MLRVDRHYEQHRISHLVDHSASQMHRILPQLPINEGVAPLQADIFNLKQFQIALHNRLAHLNR